MRKTSLWAVLTVALSPLAPAQNTTGYIAAVQLAPSQFAQVAVSNISTGQVSTTINILNSSGGTFATKTSNVAANKTFVFRFQNGSTTAVYSAVVTSSVASTIVADLQLLGSNNEVTAVLQPQPVPNLVLNIPSARLVPGQSAVAAVTNITTATVQLSLTVLDANGKTVLTESPSLSPGQTLSYSFSSQGTANNSYRVAILVSATSAVASDVMLLDKTTGQVNAILVPQPLPD